MNLKSSILLTPFIILLFDYDLYSIFSLLFISLIFFDLVKPFSNKLYLKIFISLFFIIRFISSLLPNFNQIWMNISQKNYALAQKFIDIESVFTAFSCNFLGNGEFSFSKGTYFVSCPHTVSYGPFFEIIGFKNNPFIAKYIFSFIIFMFVLIYYFKILNSLNSKQSYIFSLAILSPPVNFLLERMNFDIFIFISIYLAYKYVSKESHRNLIVFFLALMKYYPIFLIIGSLFQNVLKKQYKAARTNAIFLGIYFHLFIYLYFSELNLITQPVRPIRPDRTFGILSEALNLSNLLSLNFIFIYGVLVLLIFLFSFILRSEVQCKTLFINNLDHDLIIMFSITSLFANYDYRLAFLIFVLPTILKTENKVLILSFLLFIFSSPGLLHSYGELFQLVENYQFAYIDLTFYLLLSCFLNAYLSYLKISFKNFNTKNNVINNQN